MKKQPYVVDVSVFAGGLSLVLSFPMIYVIISGKNVGRFVFSVAGGLIGLILGIAFLGLTPTIALTVLVGSLIGLIFKNKSSSKYF